MLSYAKANAGTVTFGSAGTGSSGHLWGELLKNRANIDIQHIPYKGTAPALIDVIGGRITFVVDAAVAGQEQFKAGNLPALAVLTDCSLGVSKGEVVVVCGPSGSGKSTLIKTLNALEPFQRGDIVVDGTSLSDKKTDIAKLRSKVGIVFQSFELFPHLSVMENLTVAQIKVLGRSREEAHL